MQGFFCFAAFLSASLLKHSRNIMFWRDLLYIYGKTISTRDDWSVWYIHVEGNKKHLSPCSDPLPLPASACTMARADRESPQMKQISSRGVQVKHAALWSPELDVSLNRRRVPCAKRQFIWLIADVQRRSCRDKVETKSCKYNSGRCAILLRQGIS